MLRHTDGGDNGDNAEAAPDYAMLQQRLAHLFRRNGIRNHDDGTGAPDATDDHADSASATLQRYMAAYRLGRERAQ